MIWRRWLVVARRPQWPGWQLTRSWRHWTRPGANARVVDLCAEYPDATVTVYDRRTAGKVVEQ